MKFKCPCGELIADNTDLLRYKARCVADQDWFDFLDSEVAGVGLDWRLTRTMYQCIQCGRLSIESPDGQVVFFKLEDETQTNKNLLVSVKALLWKRPLLGTWDSSEKLKSTAKGRLYFQNHLGEGFERYHDWTALEKRYYEMFELLKQSNTLRSAVLSKDRELLHRWPVT